MDLRVFEKMNSQDLKSYIQFLLWHYRVMDSFWYLYITEKFGQPVADELNEKVWGRIAGMGAKDLMKRFKMKGQGLSNLLKAMQYWPWTIIVGYQVEEKEDEVILTVPSCITQEARLKRGLEEYPCREMHRAEFENFTWEVDPRIQVECLFAPPDPHPKEMFCKWRFTLKE